MESFQRVFFNPSQGQVSWTWVVLITNTGRMHHFVAAQIFFHLFFPALAGCPVVSEVCGLALFKENISPKTAPNSSRSMISIFIQETLIRGSSLRL